MYENRKMKPVETIPAMGEGEQRMMEEVNSTLIYCKNFCKCCTSVPPVQQQYGKKKAKKF
jgi:hypothetical protein